MERTCRDCGGLLLAGSRWCGSCGAAVLPDDEREVHATDEVRAGSTVVDDTASVTRYEDATATSSARGWPARVAAAAVVLAIGVLATLVAVGAGESPGPDALPCPDEDPVSPVCVVEVLASGGTEVLGVSEELLLVADGQDLRAVDTSSGSTSWRASLDTAQFRAVPAGDRVVVERQGYRGAELVGVDRATGQRAWEGEDGEWALIGVLERTGEAPALVLAENALRPGEVVAHDLRTGAVAWTVQVPRMGLAGNPSGVAGDEESVLLASGAGSLAVVERDSGRIRWALEPDEAGQGRFAGAGWVVDGIAVGGIGPEPQGVGAIDLGTSEVRWVVPDDPAWSVPSHVVAATPGRVLLESSNGLRAIDVGTGEVSWSVPARRLAPAIEGAYDLRRARSGNDPADWVDRPIVVASAGGGFARLDLETGEQLWEVDAPAGSRALVANRFVVLLHPPESGVSARILEDHTGEELVSLDATEHPTPTFRSGEPLVWVSAGTVHALRSR